MHERSDIISKIEKTNVENVIVGLFNKVPEEEDIILDLYNHTIVKTRVRPWILSRLKQADVEKLISLFKTNRIKKLLNLALFFSLSDVESGIEVHALLKKIFFNLNTEGIHLSLNIEDATRTHGEVIWSFLKKLEHPIIESVFLCDSVGCASLDETKRLVTRASSILKSNSLSKIKLGWHGHNDYGLATANSLIAATNGASIISGTFLGIGERAGNASLEQIIMNLYRQGVTKYNLSAALSLCQIISNHFDYTIERNRPLLGDRIFKTSLGLHQNKILNDSDKQEDYSGFQACLLGKKISLELSASSSFMALKEAFLKNSIKYEEKDLLQFKGYIYRKGLSFLDEDLSIHYKDYKNEEKL